MSTGGEKRPSNVGARGRIAQVQNAIYLLLFNCLKIINTQVLAQARASLKDPSRPYTPASLDNRTNLDIGADSSTVLMKQNLNASINNRMDHFTDSLVKKKLLKTTAISAPGYLTLLMLNYFIKITFIVAL